MSAKVTSLVDVRRQREMQSGIRWSLKAGAQGVRSRGEFNGGVLDDGRAVVALPGSDAQHVFTVTQARELGSLLSELAWDGEQRQRKARGADLWIPRSGPAPGTYLVKCDQTERLFRQTTVRRSARCESCRATIAIGSPAFCEAKPEPWAEPNWRTVKLCCECVEKSARSGIEEVKDG